MLTMVIWITGKPVAASTTMALDLTVRATADLLAVTGTRMRTKPAMTDSAGTLLDHREHLRLDGHLTAGNRQQSRQDQSAATKNIVENAEPTDPIPANRWYSSAENLGAVLRHNPHNTIGISFLRKTGFFLARDQGPGLDEREERLEGQLVRR